MKNLVKIKCVNFIKVFFITTPGIPPVNRMYLQALTLAGPTVTRLVLDLLAVLSLDNQLYI